MKIYYSIKIAWIKLLCGKIEIENDKLYIQNINDVFANIDDTKKQKEGLFIKQIIKKIMVEKMEMYFNFGIQNYAHVAAIVCGTSNIIMSFLSAKVINKNHYAKVIQNVVVENEDKIELALYTTLSISIDEIVNCKIYANKKHKELTNGNK